LALLGRHKLGFTSRGIGGVVEKFVGLHFCSTIRFCVCVF